VPGDDHLLDLAGALVDAEQPRVAEESLDGHPAHVAGAAVDLHRPVRDPSHHLAAEVLGGGRSHLAVGAGVVPAGDVQHQAAPGIQVGDRVGDQPLHQLERADRRSGLPTRPGIRHRLVHQPLGHTHAQRGDVHPAVGQAAHGRREPDVHPVAAAHHRRRRHANVVQVHVGRPCAELPHLVVARPHREARRVPRHEERRDAPRGPGVGVGAGEHHEHVGERRVGDVPLRAVEHPGVAVEAPGGGEPRGIRTCLRLGEREGRRDLATRDPRQPLLLLLLGTAFEQDVPGNAVVRAEHRTQRRRGVAELDHQAALLVHRQPQPAVLDGDGEAEQTHGLGRLPDRRRHLVLLVDLGFEGNHVLAYECSYRRQDVIQVGIVHESLLSSG
jgi:hypothetical protein